MEFSAGTTTYFMNNTHPLSNVIVTGGAGAIGSQLVKRVLSDGADSVIVIDSFTSGYRWLVPHDDRVTVIERDVCDLLTSSFPRLADPVVFHLAAFFANQNSVDHPLEDLHTNAQGTLTTLLWARKIGARRLVYASAGCSIAGHGLEVPIKEDMPVSLHLDTPYQITKALGEFYCNYFNQYIETVCCRFFNSYGPGEVPGLYRNVIPNFIWRALHHEPLTITGTGEETRDFIFVEDLVDGLVRAATLPNAPGQAFNLGTGIQTRVIDLARSIIAECRSRSSVDYVPRRSWDKSTHRQADIGKATSVLGFKPAVAVNDGLKRTVEWFVKNRMSIEAEQAAGACV